LAFQPQTISFLGYLKVIPMPNFNKLGSLDFELCSGQTTDRQTDGAEHFTHADRLCHNILMQHVGSATDDEITEYSQGFMLVGSSVVVLGESPCPRGPIYKSLSLSSKIIYDFAFCKQSVMYDHVVHKFGYNHRASDVTQLYISK